MSSIVLTDEQIGDLYQDWHFFFKSHPGGAANCIRAIEQAVLQSEQVQAWKKDAERYRWLQDRYKDVPGMLDSGAIDAAMEKQT